MKSIVMPPPPPPGGGDRPSPSIAGDACIDGLGPQVDAAGHALSLLKPLPPQPRGDAEAPPAVMAVDDDVPRTVRFQFRDALRSSGGFI